MAVRKFSPFPILKQPKFPVYQALYNLNLAFQNIAREIQVLDDCEAIPLSLLRLYRATAEELRSAINHRLSGVLHMREAKDWGRYGEQLRKAQPKQKPISKPR